MTRTQSIVAMLGIASLLTVGTSTASAQAGAKKKKKTPEVTTASVLGTIAKVSPDGKTLTVVALGGTKKQPAASTEIKVNDSTKIDYVGIESKNDQKLKVGYTVTVTLDEKEKTLATAIKVGAAAELAKKKKKADKP